MHLASQEEQDREVIRTVWLIEDDFHAEPHGEFDSLEGALAELRRRANIPWDVAPNRAPCESWRTCGRTYCVVELDASHSPSREIQRVYVLNISAEAVTWVETL